MRTLFVLLPALLLASCEFVGQRHPRFERANDCSRTDSGTVLAADSVLIPEEKPNRFYYRISVAAAATPGAYTIRAAYGPNEASGELSMPRGAAFLCPVLRRAPQPYTYTVGFYTDEDTSFRPYYEVSAQKGQIQMRYVKGYSYQ